MNFKKNYFVLSVDVFILYSIKKLIFSFHVSLTRDIFIFITTAYIYNNYVYV